MVHVGGTVRGAARRLGGAVGTGVTGTNPRVRRELRRLRDRGYADGRRVSRLSSGSGALRRA
ncbi:hypothetical protein PAI11_13870 [Patulibacter medicamentivorans]|uniref:Uncharacterized protein n=1 Tax=Patulibacter medicamentivorans TaxID=1097667 RepID=H0E3L5_9ACTN|nr:hypothetical protein PAI11_13870 [Patulibacter medicamentivorans]